MILATGAVTDTEVSLLTSWVQGGGNLIAMRPDKKLAGLLGLTDAGGTRANQYMKVDPGSYAGAGIEGQTLQFHGTADRYGLNGATAVARLYSDAATATSDPAVSLRDVGTGGGQAAAFAYDLARSVVYTRQGNPAWAGQKRDGTPNGIRPDDLFYGAKAGDVQPDWVDMSKIAVPQADEQQRLLANLITEMNRDKAPLPRFWYLPRGEKAAVVETGDDHAVNGTPAFFDRLKTSSPAGCSVADWECVRATSYLYADTAMTDAQAAAYEADGFEVALHLHTFCNDFTPASLEDNLDSQLAAFGAKWPSVKKPATNRTHCIVWSDWATEPKLEKAHGIRFDTNYYYNGPPGWLTQPGLLTGSGFPQRFADLDGSMIDVYQAMTQVTDESEMPMAPQVDTLLDNALGAKGWYGVITVNTHTDHGDHANANDIVASAQERDVPVVSSVQMMDWLDGRNASSFKDVAYSGGHLSFSVVTNPKARGLEAMLPAQSASGPLSGLTRGGQPVARHTRTVKGVDYFVFKATAGDYVATYASDTAAPDITNVNAAADADGHATVTWQTDEPATSRVDYGRTAALGSQASDSARVTDHSIELTGLEPQHHLPLPRQLHRRRGQRGQLARGRPGAGELPDAARRARGRPHRRVRRRHAEQHLRGRERRRHRRRGAVAAHGGRGVRGSDAARGVERALVGSRQRGQDRRRRARRGRGLHLHDPDLRRSAGHRLQRPLPAGQRRGRGPRQRPQRLPLRGVRHGLRGRPLPDVRAERRGPGNPAGDPAARSEPQHPASLPDRVEPDQRPLLRGRRARGHAHRDDREGHAAGGQRLRPVRGRGAGALAPSGRLRRHRHVQLADPRRRTRRGPVADAHGPDRAAERHPDRLRHALGRHPAARRQLVCLAARRRGRGDREPGRALHPVPGPHGAARPASCRRR